MTANTPRSRKGKGATFQKYVRDRIRKAYIGVLQEGDIEGRQMGGAGTDIILSPYAKEVFPFSVECKRQEKWNVHQWWEQASLNTDEGTKPLLVMKKNNSEPLVLMRFADFMEMIEHGL